MPRTVIFSLRMSEAERDMLRKQAGEKPISEYLRSKLGLSPGRMSAGAVSTTAPAHSEVASPEVHK